MKIVQKNQKGFTLIELVMVIVILGILAATALPKFIDLKSDANAAAARGYAGALTSANAVNLAGCAVAPTNTAKCTPLVTGASTKCSSIFALLSPAVAVTVGALPTPTAQNTVYIVTDTALTTSGTTCTGVLGDGTNTGVSFTYTGTATS